MYVQLRMCVWVANEWDRHVLRGIGNLYSEKVQVARGARSNTGLDFSEIRRQDACLNLHFLSDQWGGEICAPKHEEILVTLN